MLRRPLCGMAAGFIAGIAAVAYLERGWLPAGMAAALACVCRMLWEVSRQRTKRMYAAGNRLGREKSEAPPGQERAPAKSKLREALSGNREAPPGQERAPKTGRSAQLRIRLRLACCIGMIFLGGCRYEQTQRNRAEYLGYVADGMPLLVQGELASKKIQNSQYLYELKSCVIGHSAEDQQRTAPVFCDRILVSFDSDFASIGEILILNGTTKLFSHAANEGSFDEASFYEARGYAFWLKDAVPVSLEGKESRVKEWLWQLRLRIKEVYQTVLEPGEGGVLATMVLGDKELLDDETKRLYQTGGLSHIMAISGLHISVIGMAVYRFLRNRGLGFFPAGLSAGSVMCAYGVMVGAGTSVRRAVLMFLLLLLSEALGRSYDTLNALGAAALFLLWDNPLLLRDAGFLFSFAAVLGAAWVSGCVSFAATRTGKIAKAIFSGAAIQLTTLPLAAWYYYEIPVYAVGMNLLILPMMGILLAAGVLGGIAGLWSCRAAAILLFPCQKLLALIRLLCEICEGLPGAMHVTGRPSIARMAACYAILTGMTLYAYRMKKREAAAGRQGCPLRWPARVPASVAVAGMVIALLIIPPRRGFELDILDVGQGDGCFVRTEQGFTVFIDGGSSDVKKVGQYRILPFLKYNGVDRIDCWIVSHADSDHISGLKELLEQGYEVRRLVLSAGIVQDEAYRELIRLAGRNETEVLFMDAGDSLYLGEARLLALFPDAETAAGTDRNAASLVIWYEEGAFTGLFTGDIGTEEEKKLLQSIAASPESGQADPEEKESGRPALPGNLTFYKAAHHGSDYSNSDALLQTVQPLVSTVSCAARNRYGHPGEEAVLHMKQAGSEVFFTMESGQIRLTIKNGAAGVWTYRSASE
ncbi:MAG: DUF4131 domain-containing protein [Roseburia sp.]|nr:DUF4131 domain-containing protein [Roseburia sp.]